MPNQNRDREHERAVKTVAKGAGIAFLGLILGKFLDFSTRVFVARSMGPEIYGLIALGIAVISIIGRVTSFGFGMGVNRFISFYTGKKNLKKVKGAIFYSFRISLPVTLLFSFLLFLFSHEISVIFFSNPEMSTVLRIFSIALPLSVAIRISRSILLGFKMVKEKIISREISKSASTLIFVIIFFYLGFGFFGTVFSYFLGFLVSFIMGIFFIKTKILPQLKKIRYANVTKEILFFSFPLFMTSTIALIMSWTDVIMLGYFDTVYNVGIYESSLNLCILMTFVLDSFAFIILPVISELFSKNKIEEIRNIYKISTRWIFSAVFPVFLLLILFPGKILTTLFGSEFASGSTTLIILSLGYLVYITVGLTSQTITAIGKPKINFYYSFFAAISNILLNIILIPVYGMVGAAIAMTSSLLIQNILSINYLKKELQIKPYNKTYIKPIISAIFLGILFYFILKPFDGIFFILGLLTFSFFYLFIMLFIFKGLEKEDILIIKSIERRSGLKMTLIKRILKRFT